MKPVSGTISLSCAATLIAKNERTLRRWLNDGQLTPIANDHNGRMMVNFDDIKQLICVSLEPEDYRLIEDADSGNAQAQNDLALLFLAGGKQKSAVYWLQMAAKNDYPDAMHWLSRCYMDGIGLEKDDNQGVIWLSKAAMHGHSIAQEQMRRLFGNTRPPA